MSAGLENLTIKQKLFVEHYLETKNGVRAAQLAGYKGNYATLNAVSVENLQKPLIKAAINERLKPFILSADQVLTGLSSFAEADIGQVLEDDGSFSLVEAKKRGVSKLIKSLAFDKDTGKVTKVELYSAHEAKRDLGKYHKLFTDKTESIVLPGDDSAESLRKRYIGKCLQSGIPEPEAQLLADRAFAVFLVEDKTGSSAS